MVVKLPEAWFVACRSEDLGGKPRALTLQDTPLVLFRGPSGEPATLLDRCPHRNAPLSAGKVRDGELECAYHGWRFGPDGGCVAIPGLVGSPEGKARRAPNYPTVEQDGFIWVWSRPDEVPGSRPYRLPHAQEPGYTTVRRTFEVSATLHAVVENTLDVPHTAFLHGGLFRTARKENEIEVVVRRWSDRVEAEFVGEPRPKGLAGRLLSPGGGTVQHFDRFLLPSIAQVEYRLGEKSHLLATSLLSPVTDYVTRVHAAVTFRLPVPHWMVRPFVTPVATHIFDQDAKMLELQTKTVQRFGVERYASTELDVIGPQALRLLLQAQRGEKLPEGAPPEELRVRMRV